MGWSAGRVHLCVRRARSYHRACSHRMIETTTAPFPTIRLRPWLGILATAAAILASWMGLVWAPTDAVQGDVYRVIYVHVPTAWLAYLAFFVVFLASIGWLWTRRPWFDALAVASAEIGVLFTVLWMNSVHQLPTVARIGAAPALDAQMGMTLGVSVIAFTLVYFALLVERVELERKRQSQLIAARR